MNLALWKRTLKDAAWLLAGCLVTMFAFNWLFVYLTSLVGLPELVGFIGDLPQEMQGLLGLSHTEIGTWSGRLAIAYVDPTVILVSAVWSISRGSDTVSGPLDRGTMEMVLAQPVSRMSVLLPHITVTMLGAVLIAAVAWCGTAAGILTVTVEEMRWSPFFGQTYVARPLTDLVSARDYLPSAFNLFALTMFTAGLATLVSSCDRYRWRTIGMMGAFYVVQIVMKVAGLAAEHLNWLFYLTFLGAYWPQKLAVQEEGGVLLTMFLQYNGVLVIGSVVSFAAAAVVFQRRDLPAPL